MTTEQIIHKAFDVYCISLYGKTFPYTEDNLYKFLEDMYENYHEVIPQIEYKYSENIYKQMFTVPSTHTFYKNLQQFIQQYEQQTRI